MGVKEFYQEKVKPKVDNVKEKAKKGGKIVYETMTKNPMLAGMVISSVLSTAGTIVSVIARNHDEEEDRCTTYDPYAGMDLTTKHELTNGEILEMTQRMKNGDTKVEALNDMGLLREEKKRK